MEYGILIVGLIVLIVGGDFLVRGAVGFSKKLNISPLVIGMTVVAFGTSMPELLISLESAMQGDPGIAIGNVVGSNIANIALVLGITVIIFPMAAGQQTKRLDYPMLLFATALLYIFLLDGFISSLNGLILFSILIIFLIYIIRTSRKDKEDDIKNFEEEFKTEPFWKSIVFLLLGFVGLYFGSEWFVDGSVFIADNLLADNPNRDSIIGVTVVAFGTSVPELVTSCTAALKKQPGLSVGNLIGSNIFNIFAVIGITSMVEPIKVSQEVIRFDSIWMIGIALLLMLVIYVGKKIGRLDGSILLLTYITYVTVIVLKIEGIL